MNSTNSPHPKKLVDYTKQRGNHHLCAKNKVSTTMTKAFLSHEHHSYDKDIPSLVASEASSLETTDTYDICVNGFLLEVLPRRNRRQAKSDDLRESSNRSDLWPEISLRSLDAACSGPTRVDPIDFFLKIPPRTQRRRSSDLRERFQSSQSQSRKKISILQSILSESSTMTLASRRLPSSSSNSDSFRTVKTSV